LTFNAVSVIPGPEDPLAVACSASVGLPKVWTSGGVLHIRNFPIYGYYEGTASGGGAIGGTGCADWNANLRPADCLDFTNPSFGICDGKEWGTAVNTLTLDGEPLGTWRGHSGGTLVGGFGSGVTGGPSVGGDGSKLRMEYSYCLFCPPGTTFAGTIRFHHDD